jgi:hypothetical protein
MKKLLALATLFALAPPSSCQTLSLPRTMSVATPGLVTITPTAVDGDSVAWVAIDDGLQLIPPTLLKDDKIAVGMCLAPGSFRVRAAAAKVVNGKAVLSPFSECTVVVGTPAPPVPPVPPTPPVPPVPPPSPAPIPADGLHVLIVYDDVNKTKMPAAQLNVLYSVKIRDYLDAKAPLGPDGKTHEWRIWDKGIDGSADSKLWGDAMKRPRSSHPWIVVSDGKTGYEGSLPANVDDTLALLKKYGG